MAGDHRPDNNNQGRSASGVSRRRRVASNVVPELALGQVNPANGKVIGLPLTRKQSGQELSVPKEENRPYNGLLALSVRDRGPLLEPDNPDGTFSWPTSLVPMQEKVENIRLYPKKRGRDSVDDEETHPMDTHGYLEMYDKLDKTIHGGAWKDFESIDWKKVRPRKDGEGGNKARKEKSGKEVDLPRNKRPKHGQPASPLATVASAAAPSRNEADNNAALNKHKEQQGEAPTKEQVESRETSCGEQVQHIAQNTGASDTMEEVARTETLTLSSFIPEAQPTLEHVSTYVRQLHTLLRRLEQRVAPSDTDVDITSVCRIVMKLQSLAAAFEDGDMKQLCLTLGKFCTAETVAQIDGLKSVRAPVQLLASFVEEMTPWFKATGSIDTGPAPDPVSKEVEMSDWGRQLLQTPEKELSKLNDMVSERLRCIEELWERFTEFLEDIIGEFSRIDLHAILQVKDNGRQFVVSVLEDFREIVRGSYNEIHSLLTAQGAVENGTNHQVLNVVAHLEACWNLIVLPELGNLPVRLRACITDMLRNCGRTGMPVDAAFHWQPKCRLVQFALLEALGFKKPGKAMPTDLQATLRNSSASLLTIEDARVALLEGRDAAAATEVAPGAKAAKQSSSVELGSTPSARRRQRSVSDVGDDEDQATIPPPPSKRQKVSGISTRSQRVTDETPALSSRPSVATDEWNPRRHQTSVGSTEAKSNVTQDAWREAGQLWELFEVAWDITEQEKRRIVNYMARILSGVMTYDGLVEKIDKYIVGDFRIMPPKPPGCFVAVICKRNRGPGGKEMTPDNCPCCTADRESICCWVEHVEGVATGYGPRVNGKIAPAGGGQQYDPSAAPRTQQRGGRSVRWILHKR